MFSATTGGGFQILSAANKALCLKLASASVNPGSRISVAACSAAGAPGEIWNTPAIGSFVNLVAAHDNLCVDVSGMATGNGAAAIQWQCNGQLNQEWALVGALADPPIDAGVTVDSGVTTPVSTGGPPPSTPSADASPAAPPPSETGAFGGAPVTLTAQHSGKCMDIVGDHALQETCSGSPTQDWVFQAATGGYQVVSASNPLLCLNVAGASAIPGTAASVSTCSAGGVPGEIWSLTSTGANFSLVAVHDGLCLDVSGAQTTNGGVGDQWTCDGGANQLWAITTASGLPVVPAPVVPAPVVPAPVVPAPVVPVPVVLAALVGTPVTLIAQHSNKCLDIVNGFGAQEACSGAVTQSWILTPATTGYQVISASNPTLCLNVPGASADPGSFLAVSPCSATGVPGEIWNLPPAGSNYNLVAAHNGLCMDVNGVSLDDGGQVLQWTCNGQSNQVWAVAAAVGAPSPDAGVDASVPDAAPPDTGNGTGNAGVPVNSAVLLIAQGSLKCMGLDFTRDAVVQQPCTGVATQQWSFQPAPGGGYRVVWALDSARCLNVAGGTTVPGAEVGIGMCTGAPGEIWNASMQGVGFALVASHDQECLDVNGASTADGAMLDQYTCNGQANQTWQAQVAPTAPDPAVFGQWGQVIDIPSIAVAAAMLPNGKIMTWASWAPDNFGTLHYLNQTSTSIFDPQASTATSVVVTETSHDMFCPGTSMLPDGRLFVNGGGAVVANTSIYDGASNVWASDALMNEPRWYNASVTLADGRVFTLGGNQTSAQTGTGEIWTPGAGWTFVKNAIMDPLMTSDPTNRSEEHPRLFVAPNGKLFIPGPTPNMQWYDVRGDGAITAAGPRGDDTFSQNDATVMFGIGKILKAGGNTNYDRQNAASTPSSGNSYVIDINSGGTAAVTKTVPLAHPRAFATPVVLPDDTVMVVGGLDNGKAFTDVGAVYTPELFDPVTQTWRDLAPIAVPRTYHSVALLMPDGRVFLGGGGLCGHGCAGNHSDVQLYSPPYLFQPGRPQLVSAPTSTTYGTSFPVATRGTVTSFVWIRMSSTTHTVNTDQRWLAAGSTSTGPGAFSVASPANANLAPPGYYMLFAMNGRVPSIASIIRIGQ